MGGERGKVKARHFAKVCPSKRGAEGSALSLTEKSFNSLKLFS